MLKRSHKDLVNIDAAEQLVQKPSWGHGVVNMASGVQMRMCHTVGHTST